MHTQLHSYQGLSIAEIISDDVVLATPQEALDLFGSFYLEPVDGVIVHAANLPPEFFQLRTRLAGEIAQKFVNYGLKLAIVGDFSHYESKALADFIRESNRGRHLFFVPTRDEAIQRLAAAR